jgi:hypothetical protein
MSTAQKISFVVNSLPEWKQIEILNLILDELPDDVATPDDIEAINDGRMEFIRGELVAEEKINWA